MKQSKLLLLALIPLTCGCFKKINNNNNNDTPVTFNLPVIDVLNKQITLPDLPTYNVGEIRHNSENTIDYIDVYELSDFHGAVNYSSGSQIGLSRLATYLESVRSKNPGGTVVLSCGDMFQGSVESNMTRGFLVNYAMNYMGFDAMTIGNHEFDWTDEWLKNNANLTYNTSKVPFLGANIIDKKTHEIADFVVPSIKITRGDYSIGIVGTIGYGLESSILKSAVANYSFESEIDHVRSELENMQDCNVHIWASHNSVSDISYSLESTDDIDIVFGGHAHYNCTETYGDTKFAATKANGASIAHASIGIDKQTKNVVSTYVEIIDLANKLIKNNVDVDAIINEYADEINEVKNIKLGTATSYFDRDTELPNLACEAMLKEGKKFINQHSNEYGISEKDVIASFHNTSAGVRQILPEGEIIYGDIYASFPFDNELCLYLISGRSLKNKMSHLGYYATCHTYSSYTSLDNDHIYALVLIDYLATGTLGIKEENLIRVGMYNRDAVAAHIKEKGTISPNDYSNDISKFYRF